jgi:hypothetical protein
MGDVRHRAGRILAGGFAALFGACFIVAGGVSGLLANADFRASSAAGALVAAGSSEPPSERRMLALLGADSALAWGVISGDLLELAASRALLADPPNLDAAEAFSWNALRRSPTRGGAWAQLAYIDAMRDGTLDAPGREALARSFEVLPYAPEELLHWRLEFALSRWSEVDPGTRDAALREARGATIGGARWYEESLFMRSLADRLPPEAREALLRALSSES